MDNFPSGSSYPSLTARTKQTTERQKYMTTIIETFTSVPLAVTLQHVLEALKVFGPLILIGILVRYITK